MRISLSTYEVIEAVADFVQTKYSMTVDSDLITESSLEYQEREYVYKKHKNGRLKKDENGYRIVDHDKSKWITKFIFFYGELHLQIDSED